MIWRAALSSLSLDSCGVCRVAKISCGVFKIGLPPYQLDGIISYQLVCVKGKVRGSRFEVPGSRFENAGIAYDTADNYSGDWSGTDKGDTTPITGATTTTYATS